MKLTPASLNIWQATGRRLAVGKREQKAHDIALNGASNLIGHRLGRLSNAALVPDPVLAAVENLRHEACRHLRIDAKRAWVSDERRRLDIDATALAEERQRGGRFDRLDGP